MVKYSYEHRTQGQISTGGRLRDHGIARSGPYIRLRAKGIAEPATAPGFSIEAREATSAYDAECYAGSSYTGAVGSGVPSYSTLAVFGNEQADFKAAWELYARRVARDGLPVPVLMYHAVGDWLGENEMAVTTANMEAQLALILKKGFQPITFEDLWRIRYIEHPIALTFDDGYKCNYDTLFPLLRKYDFPVTLFIIPDRLDPAFPQRTNYITEDQLRTMANSGLVSVQSHSMTHPRDDGSSNPPGGYLGVDMVDLPDARLRWELEQSAIEVKRITGVRPFAFAYPRGSHDGRVASMTGETYDYAVTTAETIWYTGGDSMRVGRFDVPRSMTLARYEAMLDQFLGAKTVKKAQDDSAVPAVILNLSRSENTVSTGFSAKTARMLSKSGASVTLTLPAAEITFQPETLAALADSAAGSDTPVTVKAAAVPANKLQGMMAAQAKGCETVVSIDVLLGDKMVDVPLTVCLAYKLKAGENTSAVRVWHMDNAGNLTDLQGAFDAAMGAISFKISQRGYFAVGYDPVAMWVNVFNDVSRSSWYYDAVAFVNFYKLFEGVGGGMFAPDSTMTRAMFITVLHRSAGAPAAIGTASYTDIAPDSWYYGAVLWAAGSGLLKNVYSIDAASFSPEQAISRQEMALIFANYADTKGYAIPVNRDVLPFRDVNDINIWAQPAVNRLTAAGVFNGYDDVTFKPLIGATRAEVAQIFRNFQRFITG